MLIKIGNKLFPLNVKMVRKGPYQSFKPAVVQAYLREPYRKKFSIAGTPITAARSWAENESRLPRRVKFKKPLVLTWGQGSGLKLRGGGSTVSPWIGALKAEFGRKGLALAEAVARTYHADGIIAVDERGKFVEGVILGEFMHPAYEAAEPGPDMRPSDLRAGEFTQSSPGREIPSFVQTREDLDRYTEMKKDASRALESLYGDAVDRVHIQSYSKEYKKDVEEELFGRELTDLELLSLSGIAGIRSANRLVVTYVSSAIAPVIKMVGYGGHIKNLSRSIRMGSKEQPIISNHVFELERKAPSGEGARAMFSQVLAGQALGVEYMSCSAARSEPEYPEEEYEHTKEELEYQISDLQDGISDAQSDLEHITDYELRGVGELRFLDENEADLEHLYDKVQDQFKAFLVGEDYSDRQKTPIRNFLAKWSSDFMDEDLMGWVYDARDVLDAITEAAEIGGYEDRILDDLENNLVEAIDEWLGPDEKFIGHYNDRIEDLKDQLVELESELEDLENFDQGYVGYYVWARLGYNAPLHNIMKIPDDSALPWERREWENMIENIDDEILESKKPEELTLHDLMASEGGRYWWRENGEQWAAQFDMNPKPGMEPSDCVRVLTDYVTLKAQYFGGPDLARWIKHASHEGGIHLTALDEYLLDKVWDKLREDKIEDAIIRGVLSRI